MGREVRRVPLDFDWPLRKVWDGYFMPDRLRERTCTTCVQPKSYAGEPDRADGLTPEARAVSETFYPHMIGGPRADELAWCDKLGQAEVDMLVDEGRIGLRTLFDRVELEPPYETSEHGWEIKYRWDRNDTPGPTAAEVNAANGRRSGMFGDYNHDSINRMVLVRFRCTQLGITVECPACDGHGSTEVYPGQRAEADAWEAPEPPTGDGWQLWETTSEGSPIGPVFDSAEELARWLTTAEGGNAVALGGQGRPMTIEQARGFVAAGWAPTAFGNAGGIHDGAAYVGTEAALRGHEDDLD